MPLHRRPRSPSRRVFIHRLTFLGGGVVLLGGACSKERDTPDRPAKDPLGVSRHQTFTNPEFAVLSAAVDRLLPRDEDPGALDADVPVYIDRVLTTPELAPVREGLIGGVNALDRRSRGLFQKGFAEASAAQRDELLTLFKDGDPRSGEAKFMELLTALTLEGFLGDPSYGGNKDRVGWALMGFETSEPPQGYQGAKHLHSLKCADHECR
ncbi:MAG TPA: gluconate 2-dehydrogenase subunit 3 family protein [Myxococcaceae bacterium]|nr:gluconate 2-dehydrogenase subunit 3 family protein [Myxococcaceae bacterium]